MRLGVINGAAGMRRRGALALLVVLAGTSALASGAGRASDGTVFPAVELGSMSAGGSVGVPRSALSTTAPVLQLAADGTTVAAVVGPKSRYVIGQSTECAKQLVIWNVRRRTPVVMQGTSDPFCLPSGTDSDLAVGGGMVGVLRFRGYDDDHIIESVLSVTPIPTNGRWTSVTAVYEYAYSAGEGDYLSVLGDGPNLAFNKLTVCYVFEPGDTCPGVKEDDWWVSNGRLVEVRPRGSKGALPCPTPSGEPSGYPLKWGRPVKACRRIGSGASFVNAVALDSGRFLMLPPKGNVSIISAIDGRVTKLPIPAGAVRQADLDGHDVVILRREARRTVVVDVRDASTGALRHTWPISKAPIDPAIVELEDVHAGVAVYRLGTSIHLLRLSDGKTHTIAIPPKQGPVHARLEDPGLIYSFSTPGRRPRGRIEFVPLAHLLKQLG